MACILLGHDPDICERGLLRLKRLTAKLILMAVLPALWLGSAALASASTVRDVRLGLHPDHTRVVVDLSGAFTYRLEKPLPRLVLLYLRGAELGLGAKSLSKTGGRVAAIQALPNESGTTLRIALTEPSRVTTNTWADSGRLILDFGPLEAADNGPAGPGNKPSSVNKPEPRQTPPEQTPEADQAEQAQKTGQAEQAEQTEQTAQAREPEPRPREEQPDPPKAAPELEPAKRAEGAGSKEKAAEAAPVPRPKDALGFFLAAQETEMPVPPDQFEEQEAGPREEGKETGAGPGAGTEVTKKIAAQPQEAEPAQVPVASPTPDEPSTTLGLTRRIKPQESIDSGPVVMEEEHPEEAVKPSQVAEKARQLAERTQAGAGVDPTTKKLFESALEHYNQARYEEALQLFEEAEALSPNSNIGEKALFYQADSLFKMYQATGFPTFERVEAAYQKAIGAFPDSPEISRALLRMGIVNYDTGNADKAKGYINILLTEHPKAEESVEAKVYLARLYLDDNKPQQAIRLLREVISAHPDSPQVKTALWYLGRVLFEVGRFQESYERLTALNRGWPDFYIEEPMLLYYLGETAFRLDKLEEARDHLFRVTNIAPEISNLDLIFTRLGETYRLRNDYQKAAVLYTETQRRFPDTDGALISRIRLAETKDEEQGKAPKLDMVLGIELSPSAVKTYQSIIDKYPDRPVAQLAMLKLGALHYRDKKYLEAFNILKDLLLKYPDTEFYRDAAFALRQSFDQRMKQLAAKKDTLQLLSFYDSFKDNLPEELKVKYAHLLGDAYFDLKLYDKAKGFYEEALKAGLKDPAVELNLAMALFQMGEEGPAEEAFGTFVQKYPAHGKIGMINLYRGQALLRLNRPKEAIEAFEKVLTKGPESADYLPALGFLAETRIKTGQPELAVEVLAKALPRIPEKNEGKGRLSILLGEALLAAGRAKEAVAVLAKALQDKPLDDQHAGSYYRLGLAYLEAGRMDKAREILNKVAESGGPFWSKLAGNRLAVADLSVRLSARGQEEAQ